ncbi:MAG: hypothetical protein Q8L85_06375 [Alphaproteobacteria bacterium]|nr:hypothetical protein [Alphaproteobacteria bacterium]
MRNYFFIIILSLIFHTDAFSVGGEDELNSKKRKNIKQEIIQHIQSVSLNFHFDFDAFKLCKDDFFEESRKILLDPIHQIDMIVALVKITQNTNLDLNDRLQCLELLFSSRKEISSNSDKRWWKKSEAAAEDMISAQPINLYMCLFGNFSQSLQTFIKKSLINKFNFNFNNFQYIHDLFQNMKEENRNKIVKFIKTIMFDEQDFNFFIDLCKELHFLNPDNLLKIIDIIEDPLYTTNDCLDQYLLQISAIVNMNVKTDIIKPNWLRQYLLLQTSAIPNMNTKIAIYAFVILQENINQNNFRTLFEALKDVHEENLEQMVNILKMIPATAKYTSVTVSNPNAPNQALICSIIKAIESIKTDKRYEIVGYTLDLLENDENNSFGELIEILTDIDKSDNYLKEVMEKLKNIKAHLKLKRAPCILSDYNLDILCMLDISSMNESNNNIKENINYLDILRMYKSKYNFKEHINYLEIVTKYVSKKKCSVNELHNSGLSHYFLIDKNHPDKNNFLKVETFLENNCDIKNFLATLNIFENFNDEEFKKLTNLFSLEKIKLIDSFIFPSDLNFLDSIKSFLNEEKFKIAINNYNDISRKLTYHLNERNDIFHILNDVFYFTKEFPNDLFQKMIQNIPGYRFDPHFHAKRSYKELLNKMLYNLYQRSELPDRKKIEDFLSTSLKSSNENMANAACFFVIEHFEDMHMIQEQDLVQFAIRVRTLLDQSEDPKSPYKIQRNLENKRQSEISFENLRHFQFIKSNSKDYKLCLNPSFFKKLSEMQVDLSSAPFIDPMIIQMMLNVIEARLNPNLSNQIKAIAGMNFVDIKEGATGENNYLENLLKCDNSYIAAQLKCILNNLSKLNVEDGNETELSTQEMAIVKTFASILECGTGRDGAINEAYLQLDNKFKLKTLSNHIFDSMVMDRNLATTPKACEFLYSALNGLVENMFSGTNDLMLEICKEETIEEIHEPVHQGLYLRNLIGNLVGSWHKVKFDLNAGLYYTPLLALSRQEALELFYKHAHTSLKNLITIIQAKINNQINTLDGAALYNELFKLLNEDKTSFELDENDAPVITRDGTIKVLVQIGALEEDNRLF